MQLLNDAELVLAFALLPHAAAPAALVARFVGHLTPALQRAALRLACRGPRGEAGLIRALLDALHSRRFATASLVWRAVAALAYQTDDLHVAGCLVPTDDVTLLCALYAAGVPHAALACAEDPEWLERTLQSTAPTQRLMLCRALCVASVGEDSLLALEVLQGLARAHPHSLIRAQAAAVCWDCVAAGHVRDEDTLATMLPLLLLPAHCLGAVGALASEATSSLTHFQCADCVLVTLVHLRLTASPQLPANACEAIDALLAHHVLVDAAGNAVLWAVRELGHSDPVAARVVVQRLWCIVQGACDFPSPPASSVSMLQTEAQRTRSRPLPARWAWSVCANAGSTNDGSSKKSLAQLEWLPLLRAPIRLAVWVGGLLAVGRCLPRRLDFP